MKKIFFIVTLAFATIFAYAQKSDVNSAYNHYTNGYLDRAKAAIDKATQHDVTKNEAKTWLYCGNIYLRLAEANSNEKSADREYRKLCDNCAEVAAEAFRKAFELDNNITVSGMAISNPQEGLKYCAHYMYEIAYSLYVQRKNDEAFAMAEKAYRADRSNDYVTYFYALTAENVNKSDIAKARYNELISKDRKSKEINAYIRLANIYKSENDTAGVLRVMNAGEALFFSDDKIDTNFAVSYSILLTWAGKTEKAAEVMDKALEKYPTNYILLINYGSELSNVDKYSEAEKYFKKAVELQPESAIAVYNLGNCYYNHYIQKRKELNDIENDDEFKKGQEEATKLLEQARPYLEKAHKLDTADKYTLIMLKGVYANLKGFDEELKAIEEKLNALE